MKVRERERGRYRARRLVSEFTGRSYTHTYVNMWTRRYSRRTEQKERKRG